MWHTCVICVVWYMYIYLVHVYVEMCVIHGIFYFLWSVYGMHVCDVCVGMWYMCRVCVLGCMHVCGVPVGTCVQCIGYVCVWSECRRHMCVFVEYVCGMYVHEMCVVFQLNIWDS